MWDVNKIIEDITETYNRAINDYTYMDRPSAAYTDAYGTALWWATQVISGGVQRVLDIKSIHHKQAEIFMELAGIEEVE